MDNFWIDIVSAFQEAQRHEVLKWLFDWRLYAVVAGLVALSLLLPAERHTRRHGVSLLHDYFYGVIHTLIWVPVLALYLALLSHLTQEYAPGIQLNLVHYLPIPLQILVAALVNDFLGYVSHYLRHKVRFLWHFHTIHHSQEQLNPFTTKRTHIVEHLFSKGLIKWIPLAVMGSPLEVWLLYYLVDAAWDYFVHSNLRVSLGPLKWILVSPQYHRIHHSRLPEHFDKNFGDRFVIWDLLFGTACLAPGVYPPTGVPNVPFPHEASVKPWAMVTTYLRQWWYPFAMIFRDARGTSAPADGEPESSPGGPVGDSERMTTGHFEQESLGATRGSEG